MKVSYPLSIKYRYDKALDVLPLPSENVSMRHC
ncbi:hypothetical protein BN184_350016 [Clostridioides difficile T3]|nr:hypothetical protein BN184_350016 [Clostridioides difficile T3]